MNIPATKQQLFDSLSAQPQQVVVLPNKPKWFSAAELADVMRQFPSIWLVGTEGFESAELLRLINTGRVKGIFQNGDNLEAMVAKAQLYLENSTPSERGLHESNRRLKALTQAMIGIQRADSIGEIEMVLNEALAPTLGLAWVRIVFANQNLFERLAQGNVASFDFFLKEERLKGKMLFGRADKRKFKVGEKKFLQEITDTASLALGRLGKLEEAETLKQQWEATFDAISHPLCLTTKDNGILRTNLAFSRATGIPFRDLVGKNALRVFFPNLSVEVLDSPLRLSKGEGLQKREFEIVAQSTGRDPDGTSSRLILFRDVTEQIKLERRILESSKFAELGTIASSIAHELNNPLGGMLSFLQLIRMDLAADDPITADIASMEEATLRCRDIVQNLLGFARLREPQSLSIVDFAQEIRQAVKLIELQTRTCGIDVHVNLPASPTLLIGQPNSLSQAICNILQNSIDAVTERARHEPNFSGRIDVELITGETAYRLRITDNGLGIRPEHEPQVITPLFSTKASETNAGLGLTIAYSIVRDHHGDLEIISHHGAGTTVVLSLPAGHPSVHS